MTEAQTDVVDQDNLIDNENGLVDRRIFSDEGVYQAELKKIFARGWNFMCHDSQLPERGSYFTNYIGEDEVIAVRDDDLNVQVLINSCPHRGNTVCRAEQGKARSFFCSYHGWNFGLNGDLIGLPGQDTFYRGGIDKKDWGLTKAAKVESYKGFVFATLDPDAIPLDDFLGWVGRLGIDQIAEQGDVEVVDGVQKNIVKCNWKLAVDNLFDWYHPKISHGSAVKQGMLTEEFLAPMNQMVIMGEYGHAIGGAGVTEEAQQRLDKKYANVDTASNRKNPKNSNSWRGEQSAKDALGPVGIRSKGHPNIFPNLWVSTGGTQLCLRLPKGPMETELWWFTFVEKSMAPEVKRRVIQGAIHFFGPSGLLEQDDGENWSHATTGSKGLVTGSRPLNFKMGMGMDEVLIDPNSGQARIETVLTEHAQRWLYQSWAEWMKAENWEDLIKSHSPEPRGTF
ncbi:MAG: Rieske 2Fe-2S domain-containing protein [Pseudomonadales bacterium]|nr:Rieske 2Fe-2S domain-containing protein [Pseudomonadales bacterium]